MTGRRTSPFPSVDTISQQPELRTLYDTAGHTVVIDAIRTVVGSRRAGWKDIDAPLTAEVIAAEVHDLLRRRAQPSLRRMFNLSGTVLHTNLGRAMLSEEAIAHACMAMREPCNLEFDIADGRRGERDSLVEGLLCELTGAEAATVVNNNAAAVLLVLAALAASREVVVSRGELIEIGGAFRIPDVMRAATARLVEVGTTNRTHPHDYTAAIGAETAALMKVHTSNFAVVGFVAAVEEADLARIAHEHDLPMIVDLGAGSLIDMTAYGLPKEPVVRDTLRAGADVVTFSGDKLMGGPQAGLVVGCKALIERIRRHPLKRALRVGKVTIAALEATLMAYRTPAKLARDLPTLRLLTRGVAELHGIAARIQAPLAAALGPSWDVAIEPVTSQIGSGVLPTEHIPSVALAVCPAQRGTGDPLGGLADRLRALPIPVLGRIANNRLLLDMRCLEDEAGFVAQFLDLAALSGEPA